MLFGFLSFFDNLLADFPHAFLRQPFSAVARVIAVPRFVLLDKANCPCGSEFAEQGFKSNGADFVEGQVGGRHFKTSSSHFTGFSTVKENKLFFRAATFKI